MVKMGKAKMTKKTLYTEPEVVMASPWTRAKTLLQILLVLLALVGMSTFVEADGGPDAAPCGASTGVNRPGNIPATAGDPVNVCPNDVFCPNASTGDVCEIPTLGQYHVKRIGSEEMKEFATHDQWILANSEGKEYYFYLYNSGRIVVHACFYNNKDTGGDVGESGAWIKLYSGDWYAPGCSSGTGNSTWERNNCPDDSSSFSSGYVAESASGSGSGYINALANPNSVTTDNCPYTSAATYRKKFTVKTKNYNLSPKTIYTSFLIDDGFTMRDSNRPADFANSNFISMNRENIAGTWRKTNANITATVYDTADTGSTHNSSEWDYSYAMIRGSWGAMNWSSSTGFATVSTSPGGEPFDHMKPFQISTSLDQIGEGSNDWSVYGWGWEHYNYTSQETASWNRRAFDSWTFKYDLTNPVCEQVGTTPPTNMWYSTYYPLTWRMIDNGSRPDTFKVGWGSRDANEDHGCSSTTCTTSNLVVPDNSATGSTLTIYGEDHSGRGHKVSNEDSSSCDTTHVYKYDPNPPIYGPIVTTLPNLIKAG